MTSTSTILRSLLIYSICVPLALFLGYFIAQENNPLYNPFTYFGIGPILLFLVLPLLLRWHHAWLIVSWNFSAVLFFLPGRPELWMGVAWLSLSMSIIQYILNRRLRFLSAPGVTRSLLFLAAMVFATAEARGGFGLASFGSELQGGRRYFVIYTAIIGYFALISRPIPPRHASKLVVLFFLGSTVAAIGDLGSILPESFYFIYLLFPITQYGLLSIIDTPGLQPGGIARLGGVAFASCGAFYAMLARFGIREIFVSRHIFRMLLFISFVCLSAVGGFRGNAILIILLFTILFCLEGLLQSRLLPIFALSVVLIGALLVGFSQRLPTNVQRTLSVLHLPVSQEVKLNAEYSSEWRLNIWRHVIPQIPQYLLVGKGLGINASEMRSLVTVNPISGIGASGDEGTELAADYHNGPLSLILPFGIAGVLGFLWFLAACWKVFYKNYLYGNPAHLKLNRFLLAYFITKTIFFFCVFGNFYSDLAMFTGLVGVSISLNGGIARRFVLLPHPKSQAGVLKLPQGARRPIPAHV
jgi:hypothetical protein